MARARSPDSIEAEKLYKSGMSLVKIAAQLGVPDGTVRRWKSTQDWDGKKANDRNGKKPNARKRGGQPGNKNAKGHGGTGPPGNQNALKHGGYSQIFWDTLSEKEKELIETMEKTPEQMLLDEISLLTVREHRIMTRIKYYQDLKGGLALESVLRSEDKRQFANENEKLLYDERIEEKVAAGDRLPGHAYHVQNRTESTYNIIQRLEEALSRCQDQKRRAIDSLTKLYSESGQIKGSTVADDWVAAVLEADEDGQE